MKNNKMIVCNPKKSETPDLTPLIKMVNTQFTGFNVGNNSLHANVDNVIRLLSTAILESDLHDMVRYMCDTLYEIRDAIGQINDLSPENKY